MNSYYAKPKSAKSIVGGYSLSDVSGLGPWIEDFSYLSAIKVTLELLSLFNITKLLSLMNTSRDLNPCLANAMLEVKH